MSNDEPTIETLRALCAERDALRKRIPELQAELKSAEARLRELLPGHHRDGLIEQTRKMVRNQKFPIWTEQNGYNVRRIVGVGEKWISIRGDWSPDDQVTQYCRETGREKGTRRGSKWNTPLDVAKALAIWTEHQKQTKP